MATNTPMLLNIPCMITGEDERGSCLVLTLADQLPGNRILEYNQGENHHQLSTPSKIIQYEKNYFLDTSYRGIGKLSQR